MASSDCGSATAAGCQISDNVADSSPGPSTRMAVTKTRTGLGLDWDWTGAGPGAF